MPAPQLLPSKVTVGKLRLREVWLYIVPGGTEGGVADFILKLLLSMPSQCATLGFLRASLLTLPSGIPLYRPSSPYLLRLQDVFLAPGSLVPRVLRKSAMYQMPALGGAVDCPTAISSQRVVIPWTDVSDFSQYHGSYNVLSIFL